ncbi:hypothetical protein BCR34DRAFT_277745 [Clohesyomyces aquaticus]|uniref:Blastomyces yeast-phase-specific protein n=1 Tax=Clohesyomyces aquaticus TaxID=1231657 RepID=A0A1Y1ZRX9_9PLEO|nr:hypothetical protein BCR34DRAFT_277745 [Clohesyomyces aquaticus]
MISQVLAMGGLVALAQSKAVISNMCSHPIYVWSVPAVPGAAENFVLKPNTIYEEPFRHGTTINPGIAIKVTMEADGIYNGKPELNFQYNVDKYDENKLWIGLATVRGSAFDGNTAFWTCYGPYKAPNVPTRLCQTSDNIELVLCGSQRTQPEKSPAPAPKDCAVEPDGQSRSVPRRCLPRIAAPKRTEPKKAEPKKEEQPKEQPKDLKPKSQEGTATCKCHCSDDVAGTVARNATETVVKVVNGSKTAHGEF